MVTQAQLKKLKLEELLDANVRGLLFDCLKFSQIEEMLQKKPEFFSFFTIAAIDGFSNETNPVFLKEILANVGSTGVLEENSLKIVGENISKKSGRIENKVVKYISYNSKFRYYMETRKIGSDRVLLSNGKNVVESSICNKVSLTGLFLLGILSSGCLNYDKNS